MTSRSRSDRTRDWGRAIARWITVTVLMLVGLVGTLFAEWGFGRSILSDGTVVHSYLGFVWWIPSLLALIAAARLATDGPGLRRTIALLMAGAFPVAILIRWLLGFWTT